jgi:hypothetical protein
MATTEAQAPERGSEQEKEGRPVTVRRGPELPLPGVHLGMPTGLPGRVLWWGGLAALAAFDVVDWPVAVLVGAGSWVAEQYAKEAAEREAAMSRRAS